MKKIISLLFLLFLSSCNPAFDYIDSDDFGYPKLTISSQGNNVFSGSPTGIPQCSYWTNTNMSLNGERLFILVKNNSNSMWSPWLANTYCQYNPLDSSSCQNLNDVISPINSNSACGFSCANPLDAGCASNYNYNPVAPSANLPSITSAQSYISTASRRSDNNDIAGYLKQAFDLIATNSDNNPPTNYGTSTPAVSSQKISINLPLPPPSTISNTTNVKNNNVITYTTQSTTVFTTSTTAQQTAISSISYSINFDDIDSNIQNAAAIIATALTTISNYISVSSQIAFFPNYNVINNYINNAIINFNASTGSYYDINTCPDYNLSAPGCLVYNSKIMYDPQNTCLLKRGDGLYGLIVPPNTNIDSDKNIACNILPQGNYYGFHLGGNPIFYDTTNSNCVSAGSLQSNNNNCLTSGYNNKLPDQALINTDRGDLYFKIIDSYYPDNSGSYTVMMKSGVGYVNSSGGPIAGFLSNTSNFFHNIGQNLYNSIISQISTPINVLLILYIIFIGISLAFGLSKMNNKLLMLHIFKIVIVVQLIVSDSSWHFFTNHLLDLFTDGADQLSCMISTGGSCVDNTEKFSAFDDFISDFFSYETQMKIWSLTINDIGIGLIEAIIIEIGLFFFLIMIGYAAIFYMIGFLGIYLLIALFPIFLPFILFTITKEFFNNWIKMIVTSSMEPIIVIAFLSLSAQTITNQFHILLGFPIKYQNLIAYEFPHMPSIIKNNIIINSWIAQKPSHFDTKNDPTGYVNMLIPDNIIDSRGNPVINSQGNLCVPYACSCYRVPTLPYLQPNQSVLSSLANKEATPCDNLGYDNQNLIDKIMHTGLYTNLSGAFSFLMMTGMLLIFIKSIPSIARSLVKGTIQTNFDMSSAPLAAISGLKSMAYGLGGVADRVLYNRSLTYRKTRAKVTNLITDVDKLKKNYQDAVGGKIDYIKKMSLGDLPIEKYKQINETSTKLANKISKSSLGTAVKTLEPALNKISGLSTDEFIKTRFIHNQKNEKPIIHHVVARADQLINRSIDFVNIIRNKPNSQNNHIDLNDRFEKFAGRDAGETIDSLLNLYNTYKDHALYNASFGLIGRDMHKPLDARENEKSRIESANENFIYNLNLNEQEQRSLAEYLKDKSEKIIFKEPVTSTRKKIYGFFMGDNNKIKDIQNQLNNNLLDNSAPFNQESILTNLKSLQNPTKNITITLSNGNGVSLRADQLIEIINQSNNNKDLESKLLEKAAEGRALINLSKDTQRSLKEKLEEFEKQETTQLLDSKNQKLIDEIYNLKPDQIIILKISADDPDMALTAKDLKEILQHNPRAPQEELKEILINKIKEYQELKSRNRVFSLMGQLSMNARKNITGEAIAADEKIIPHEVSSHLKKTILMSILFPPLALPYGMLAGYNAFKNAKNIYNAMQDKKIKNQINEELKKLNKNSFSLR